MGAHRQEGRGHRSDPLDRSTRIDERTGSIKMTDKKEPQQPEAASTEPAPGKQATPKAKKRVAASKELAPPLVEPSASLVGPIESKPVEEPIPTTWDDAGEGLVITDADLEGAVHSNESRTLKRSYALPPGVWIQGPGLTEVLAEGMKLMRGATRAAGMPIKEIKAVYAVALPKAQMVLVKAVKEGTANSIKARREGKGPLIFSLSDILREAEMEVASGYREFYSVKKVSSSPIGPCVGISMVKPVKTRRVGEKEHKDDDKEKDKK